MEFFDALSGSQGRSPRLFFHFSRLIDTSRTPAALTTSFAGNDADSKTHLPLPVFADYSSREARTNARDGDPALAEALPSQFDVSQSEEKDDVSNASTR